MALEEGRGNFFADKHGHARMCPRTIGTGFTDDKDSSKTIRTGFTDRFVVSQALREVTERLLLRDESI